MNITGPAVGLVAALAVWAGIEGLIPTPPIQVHKLHYVASCEYQGQQYAHCIVQDRTITASGDVFYMSWEASIYGADGLAVPECTGSGSFKYPVGRKAAALPLAIWTGNGTYDSFAARCS